MADYRVFETESFQKDIARFSRAGLKKIKEKLQVHVYGQLRDELHFGSNIKKLKNWEPPTWRYRIGAWRFFYEINEEEKIVLMIAAEHRSSAY